MAHKKFSEVSNKARPHTTKAKEAVEKAKRGAGSILQIAVEKPTLRGKYLLRAF